MSDKSGIQWTDATWNPVTGCSKVSQGCKHCYALRDWARVAAPRATPNVYTGREFTDVMFHPERLDQPLRWKKPRRIFVNSMSDLFHENVPDGFIADVFATMGACDELQRGHVFQVLTKRPARMFDWCCRFGHRAWNRRRIGAEAWPARNVWLGVSVEDQQTADERIPLLLQTPAALRFVSYEPALGPVDLAPHLACKGCGTRFRKDLRPAVIDCCPDGSNMLDWVIVGGESGPGARPCDVAWIRSAVEQCKAAGVPCFVKQLGARPFLGQGDWKGKLPQMRDHLAQRGEIALRDRKGGDPAEWPADLRVREMPR